MRLRSPYWSAALLTAAATFGVFTVATCEEKKHPVGYSDTPKLPHSQWKVHDIERPRPPVVSPGKTDAAPPSDAIVLFGGENADAWQGREGGPAGWKIENGELVIVPGAGDILTRQEFGDCQLHIEWKPNTPPESNSQHRSNSGIFFFDRYEIQVLDCFDNDTYADGHAGAIYGQYPPLVNANRPPSEWQSYDIVFVAPRFDDAGNVVSPAKATVFMNGILVQHAEELLGGTVHKNVGKYSAHGPKGRIRLQDHKDQPIRFRNIWIRELNLKRE